MNTKVKLSLGILFLFVLFFLLPLLLIKQWLCDNHDSVFAGYTSLAQPGIAPSKTLTFTAVVTELGTTETGRHDISLGRIEQPWAICSPVGKRQPATLWALDRMGLPGAQSRR
jgi:hypothetical protein